MHSGGRRFDSCHLHQIFLATAKGEFSIIVRFAKCGSFAAENQAFFLKKVLFSTAVKSKYLIFDN